MIGPMCVSMITSPWQRVPGEVQVLSDLAQRQRVDERARRTSGSSRFTYVVHVEQHLRAAPLEARGDELRFSHAIGPRGHVCVEGGVSRAPAAGPRARSPCASPATHGVSGLFGEGAAATARAAGACVEPAKHTWSLKNGVPSSFVSTASASRKRGSSGSSPPTFKSSREWNDGELLARLARRRFLPPCGWFRE